MSHTISLPVVRFSLAGLLAFITTFLLFFFMQNLVRTTDIYIVENTPPTPKIDFVRVKHTEVVKTRKIVDPPPAVVDPPPVIKPRSLVDPHAGDRLVNVGPVTTTVPGGRINPGTLAVSDGDLLPVLKVQPNYPGAAIARGTEGYVIVEFTVTTTGATRDIRIVEAQPDNIFNSASIQAAGKFKYKPRVINGTAVEVRGVRNKFIFRLE